MSGSCRRPNLHWISVPYTGRDCLREADTSLSGHPMSPTRSSFLRISPENLAGRKASDLLCAINKKLLFPPTCHLYSSGDYQDSGKVKKLHFDLLVIHAALETTTWEDHGVCISHLHSSRSYWDSGPATSRYFLPWQSIKL